MYQQKYYKYRERYLALKNYQKGGSSSTNEPRKAIVFIRPCDSKNKIDGIIYFEEVNNKVRLHGEIKGLTPGKHGFHIHESGNLSHCCSSLKGHFNPTNQTHGGPNSTIRHVGDLGNIEANNDGIAKIDMIDPLIKLDGSHNIIGRSIVIHADEDDLGTGGNAESLKTGNAGARIAYGIIGIDC